MPPKRPQRSWEIWLHALFTSWRLLLFALACAALLWATAHYFLLPAAQTLPTAPPEQKRTIKALSLLLLAILLTLLTLATLWATRRRK